MVASPTRPQSHLKQRRGKGKAWNQQSYEQPTLASDPAAISMYKSAYPNSFAWLS